MFDITRIKPVGLKTVAVKVPEWETDKGDTVMVLMMSGKRRMAYTFALGGIVREAEERGETPDYHSILVAATLCDEDGTLVFPDIAQGYKVCCEAEGAVVSRLGVVSQELNKIGEKHIEAAEKKSDAIQA